MREVEERGGGGGVVEVMGGWPSGRGRQVLSDEQLQRK
jgi:hypothetical protein